MLRIKLVIPSTGKRVQYQQLDSAPTKYFQSFNEGIFAGKIATLW